MCMGIVPDGVRVEQIRRALREAPLVALREKLTDEQILEACRACGHQFRRRRYGPVVTVFHFLAQAVQRESSFAATWQQLWTPLAADFPEMALDCFYPSALTHARRRLPQPVLQTLAAQACGQTRQMPFQSWRGWRLLALDASTVSMPREEQLFAHFGAHHARSTMVRYPLATFAVLLCVGTSLVLDYRLGPFDPGEDRTSRALLSHPGPKDLLLADRSFAGSPTLARIKARGADFLMRKNARLIVSRLPVIRRLGSNDFITRIPMSKPARQKDPALPESVVVRLFRARWKTPAGEHVSQWFVTSLEDAKAYPRAPLARLYHRRWQMETSYLEFKQTFHADVLRSKTVENIYKEFSAHVLAYQLVRLLMQAAATKHHKQPTEISFLQAARWVLCFSQRMAAAPAWGLPIMYERLLDAIASCEIDVRPGRLEPRAITREQKHYGRLKIPRAQWRQQRLAGST